MSVIIWDKVEDRTYETGLDRGVLYLPNGTVVPWNGLTSVIESFDKEVSPVYYDGMKVSDLVTLGDFTASLHAVTYPDEFTDIEGVAHLRRGVFVGDQKPKTFGLSYRTQIGNALEGDVVGYKIHILYNVTAIPKEKTYATVSADPSLVEFEWDLTAIPEDIPGMRPTAHIIINSLDTDRWLMQELEEKLYGSSTAVASLIPMFDLVSFIKEWFRVKIVDNGDGTWTAITKRSGFISFLTPDIFQIEPVNAIYLNDYTFVISDTRDEADVLRIYIIDNLDGTWTGYSSHEGLINEEDGVFQILEANAVFIGTDTYQLSDTEEED